MAKTSIKKNSPAEEGVLAKGTYRAFDVPWNDKKIAIFRAMTKLGATNTAGNAAPGNTIAAEANVSNRDVRHYCYHGAADNLVKVVQQEGVRGYCFVLTKKGINHLKKHI